LTLAIDVHSRCVAGFHLSLDPPSATSVALCVEQACLPKDAWLAAQGIEGEWLVRGLLDRLHLDNAKEFHTQALRRGCEQYGITIDYRPVRTPHYGGHIERLIGTMMGRVHLLPCDNGSSACSSGNRIFGASIAAKRMRNSTIYRTKSTLQRAFLRITEN
jgi:putative transposase